MDLEPYIQKRLDALQKRYCFDPAAGAEQTKGRSPQFLKAYGAYSELLSLSRKLGLDVDVPTEFGAVQAERPVWAYAAQLVGTHVWKIGHSINPVQRVQEVQVGNHESLVLKYTVPGGRPVEQLLLRYFGKHKTRNRHRKGSEWREVRPKVMRETFTRIEKEGTDFLREARLPKDRD